MNCTCSLRSGLTLTPEMSSGIVEFHSKISAIAPAQVKIKIAALVGNERQTQAFIFADRPVPTARGTGYFSRKTSHHFKFLVRDTNDVEEKIMHRISKTPQHIPRAVSRAIPRRRDRILQVTHPKKWVEFLQRGRAVERNIFYNFAGSGVGSFRRVVRPTIFSGERFATARQRNG